MAETSLDDAFAAFLEEVQKEDASEAASKTKRARLPSETEAAQDRLRVAASLRKASYLGKLSEVRKLLRGLAAVDRLLVVDAAEEDGLTALHLAVITGHEGVAAALLQGRADVDAASLAGDTPLMWAAHQGRDSICQLLLSWGADATLKNASQQNAAMQAAYQGFRHIKTFLDHHDAWKATGESAKTPSSSTSAAAARRAANLAEVAQSLREEAERKEDDAFWASVRARRDRASGDEELFRDFASTTAKGPSVSHTFEEPRRLPGHLRGPYRVLDLGQQGRMMCGKPTGSSPCYIIQTRILTTRTVPRSDSRRLPWRMRPFVLI
ncbi:Osbpl1a [Symbiodinium sp. CCMP2592]|nr:Osbpl1a [Symbiodinium sp. CCMP2592]